MEPATGVKLSWIEENISGLTICPDCGAKSPGISDCPNKCRAKRLESESVEKAQKTREAEHTLLLQKLEAIGYSGQALTDKAREVEAQIIAASYCAQAPVSFTATKISTIVGGVLLAQLISGVIGLIVLGMLGVIK